MGENAKLVLKKLLENRKNNHTPKRREQPPKRKESPDEAEAPTAHKSHQGLTAKQQEMQALCQKMNRENKPIPPAVLETIAKRLKDRASAGSRSKS